MSEMLRVENLNTYFDTRKGLVKAVDGISFSIDKGEILGIVGVITSYSIHYTKLYD